MTKKELFLSCKTWDEFQARKEEIRGIVVDEDVRKHLNDISPKHDNSDYEKGIIIEVYKTKRNV